MINKLSNNYILFLCILLCILVFFPITQTGFTTSDDTILAIGALKNDDTKLAIGNLNNASIRQGRIGVIPMMFLTKLPYLIDNEIYFQTIRTVSLLLTITTFAFCVFYLLNSYSIAILSTIFSLGFLQNTWEHNLITSYPFSLQCNLQFFFISLIVFKKYLLSKKIMYGILSAAFYFCAMFYELFILYFPFFLAIQCQNYNRNGKPFSGKRVREILYESAPVIIAIVIYLILYAVWRYLLASSHGYTLLLNSPIRTAFTVFQLSISSLPGYYFFSEFGSQIFFGFNYPFSISGFIDQVRVEWIVKACLIFWSTMVLLYRVADENLRTKSVLYSLLLCISAIFLPNILLGFTSKYQSWVFSGGVKGYTTTYYSFFATVCALALLVTYILQFVKRRHNARIAIVLFFAITASCFSYFTDYYNFFVAQDQKLSHIKWKIVDKFLQTPQFEMIPDGSVIYAPTLYEHRGIVEIYPGYWAAYVNRKTGKNLKILERLSENEIKNTGHIYFLKFQQEPHTENQFLVFGKMETMVAIYNEIPIGYSATIFSYSINRIVGLIGCATHDSRSNDSVVFVNNLPVQEKRGGAFVAQIDLSDIETDFPEIRIKSDSLIYLNDFIVTYYKDLPSLSETLLKFRSGWSKDEVAHTWSVSKSAEIHFFSSYNISKSAFIEFSLRTLKPRTVKMIFNSVPVGQVMLSIGKPYQIKLKGLRFNPGKNILKFETDVPPALPGNGDPRALSFAISGVQCEFE